MPTQNTNGEAPSLKKLLETTDPDLRDLFIKVMNLHAAHQITFRTQAQLVADVRKHIEDSMAK